MQIEVGQWYLYGYEPVIVKSVEENGYTVSTGHIEIGTRGDMLYPMTLQNKTVADCVAEYRREMSKLCRHVNWPDLSSWIEQALHDAADDPAAQKAVLDKLVEMKVKLQELHDMVFEGTDVHIFRRF